MLLFLLTMLSQANPASSQLSSEFSWDMYAYQRPIARVLEEESALRGLRYPEWVSSFYHNHHYPYLWNTQRRQALLRTIEEAELYDGLPRSRYHYDQLHTSHTLESEILFTDAFFTLAHDLANGFLDPKKTHRTWNAERVEQSAFVDWLKQSIHQGVQETLHSINQDNPRYQALRLLHREMQHSDLQHQLKKKNITREIVAINLERQRWLPQKLGHEYVLVNIPSYRVQVYEGDKVLWDDKVMIGKANKPTPAFVDKMQSVVMSPAWYAPPSLRKNGRTVVPPGTNNNPMGKVKFQLPNPHAIILHDTNQRHLFKNESRAFSAGCVRVNNAEGLANVILRNHLEWHDSHKINNAMNKRHETRVGIEPVPVYLTYWTLWGDQNNRIYQAKDVYGKDKALLSQYQQALGKR